MESLYPQIQPYDHGLLAAESRNHVYWEACGNPCGKPAVVLHGGPGSGCTEWHRRLFDPRNYRIVLFDQRGCGRSTPNAGGADADLANNTTPHLLADIEGLRQRLGIDRWLVLGGSWGSTLALAYAEQHTDHVTEMVLFGVTTGRHREFDWTFRGGLSPLFPEQWDRLRAALPAAEREGDVVEGYYRLLHHPDQVVRQRAADAWCLWESATPTWPPTDGFAHRFADPAYRLAFARIVTHYVAHNAWIEDGHLLRGADVLADVPGILVNGRLDLQAPLENAWELKRVWPRAELVVVVDAGHTPDAGTTRELVRATDRFASV